MVWEIMQRRQNIRFVQHLIKSGSQQCFVYPAGRRTSQTWYEDYSWTGYLITVVPSTNGWTGNESTKISPVMRRVHLSQRKVHTGNISGFLKMPENWPWHEL